MLSPIGGRWRSLVVTQLAAFMALLDVSIVNVALPSIERELDVSAATAQWVVSGYALTLGLTLVPAGRLGDAFGRRRMFLIALSAFIVTSALTGAAPSTELLIAARLVQGVAGGMLIPQNSGLIQELFSGAERGRAFGFLGATVGLATAAGPVIGGLILAMVGGAEGWRWVFYVNVPIGVIALVLAAASCRLRPAPAGAAPTSTSRARYCSAVACSACWSPSTRVPVGCIGCGHCGSSPRCCSPCSAGGKRTPAGVDGSPC